MNLLVQEARLDSLYRLIPLTQGQFAIVDPEDYDRLTKRKWRASWSNYTNSFYAISNDKGSTIKMHREVLCAPKQCLVDHKRSGQTLDNRKSNLRLANRFQNCHNRRMLKSNTSGFRGVTRNTKTNKWRAKININGKMIHLGYYEISLNAAQTYDKAAFDHYGEFAALNFPLETLQPDTF